MHGSLPNLYRLSFVVAKLLLIAQALVLQEVQSLPRISVENIRDIGDALDRVCLRNCAANP